MCFPHQFWERDKNYFSSASLGVEIIHTSGQNCHLWAGTQIHSKVVCLWNACASSMKENQCVTVVGQKGHDVPRKAYLVQVALDNHQTEVSCSSLPSVDVFIFLCLYNNLVWSYHPPRLSTFTFLINRKKCAVGLKSVEWFQQDDTGCEGCRGACSLAMPQPVWSALGWRLSPPQIMQLCSCLAGLRLHRGKIIITACLEHTRNLWQRNRILPEITMAETSFFPSVLIFRLLHAPFLSLPSL